MSMIKNENLMLTSFETKNLLDALLKPEKSVIEKRNKFWEEIDEMNIKDMGDGSSFIEIPNLDIVLKNRIVDTAVSKNVKIKIVYESINQSDVKISNGYIGSIYEELDGGYRERITSESKYQNIYGYNTAVA